MENSKVINLAIDFIKAEHRLRQFEYSPTRTPLQEAFCSACKILSDAQNLRWRIVIELARVDDPFVFLTRDLLEEIERRTPLELEGGNRAVTGKEIMETLRVITNGQDPYPIRVARGFLDSMMDSGAIDDQESKIPTLSDIIFAEFSDGTEFAGNARVTIPEYYENRVESGLIFHQSVIPKNLQEYFREIRDAYSFGLPRSVIALCRALFESVLIETFPPDQQKRFREGKTGLGKIIQSALDQTILDKPMKDLANSIRQEGCMVLHRGEQGSRLDQERALNVIRNTINLIEFLDTKISHR